MTDYERLRALAEQATPGPWETGGSPDPGDLYFGTVYDPDDRNEPGILLGEAYAPDAEFIAATDPDTVRDLLEDLRLTRAERDAEKKKAAQRAKDHAREKAEAWEQGLSAGFHATNFYVAPRNPYRLDTQEEA